jgi:glycosyltransferase involved in cell wall biosynthesis
MAADDITIAVVIPSYKVTEHILRLIGTVGSEVSRIYVIDDCCPHGSGTLVEQEVCDPRVKVIRHHTNQGVGGAVITGYQAAIEDGIKIIVKVDGDGQMDPALIPEFVQPIIDGEADYTKGNRFFDLEAVKSMPRVRLFGNAVLSFMAKLSSGYWNLFDPTNGYTAIHADVARHLPFSKISKRYFFETDMLFRLNTLRAVVLDIPMNAKYGDEISGLKVSRIVSEFLWKHLRNYLKRILYNYYLRDMTVASIELPLGVTLILFGAAFGGFHWISSLGAHVATPTGTIMLAAISLLMGLQFILAFLSADISSVPRRPISRSLSIRFLRRA